jgi:DNA polymerase I-like protein with 3'-5' exonuclease and polymerase domains
LFFAILYGAGPSRIAKQLKKSFMEAKYLIEKLNRAMPAIQELKDNFCEALRRNNGVLHSLLRRRLIYPDILSDDDKLRSCAERQIFNAFIQGSAGDILKALTIESAPTIHHYGGRIAAAVHDEVLGYVPKKKAQELCEELSYIFSSSQFIEPVPIVAEFRYGNTWGEIH